MREKHSYRADCNRSLQTNLQTYLQVNNKTIRLMILYLIQ